MEEQTDLFGIPVPSTDKVFISIVVVHITIALICVVSGLLAVLRDKSGKKHRAAGNFYFWSMLLSFITVIILSIMRWPHNVHLLLIGTLAFGFTYAGRTLAKIHSRNWTRFHTMCMGFSYILLLTGFYVDNGKNLPFWNQFSTLFFYIFPSVVGIPIIIYVLIKHPLNIKWESDLSVIIDKVLHRGKVLFRIKQIKNLKFHLLPAKFKAPLNLMKAGTY